MRGTLHGSKMGSVRCGASKAMGHGEGKQRMGMEKTKREGIGDEIISTVPPCLIGEDSLDEAMLRLQFLFHQWFQWLTYNRVHNRLDTPKSRAAIVHLQRATCQIPNNSRRKHYNLKGFDDLPPGVHNHLHTPK